MSRSRMPYFAKFHLRQTGQFDFAMDCPYCPDGSLRICVDPELLEGQNVRDSLTDELWGIKARQCSPGCDCPLSYGEIVDIQNECLRRSGQEVRQEDLAYSGREEVTIHDVIESERRRPRRVA